MSIAVRRVAPLVSAVLSVAVATGVAAQSPGTSPETPAADCAPTPIESDTFITLDVEGTERTALLRAPSTPPGPRPLVLAFHGYGGGAWDLGYVGELADKAEAEGFVVAYPQGIGEGPTWDLAGGTDIPFVLALIDELVATQCVDPGHVFATGFSMGGGMTNVLACRVADRVAAIATVAANHGDTWGDPCAPSRPTPILAFHGTLDEALPYEGGDSPFPDRPVTPVEAWMADWAATNGCAPEPVVASVAADVDSLTWEGCTAPTTLYRVAGGGHTWPGGQNDPTFGSSTDSISATDLMWDLFRGSGTTTAP
jgi:polyhydroxybutyrate depolymerase